MDDNNLKMCGTIHSHPTFASFLSSVDLHNHYLIQKCNPNAIAIVYSDLYDEAKIFQLTKLGMETIEKCSLNLLEHHKHETDANKLYKSVSLDVQYTTGHGKLSDLRNKTQINEAEQSKA